METVRDTHGFPPCQNSPKTDDEQAHRVRKPLSSLQDSESYCNREPLLASEKNEGGRPPTSSMEHRPVLWMLRLLGMTLLEPAIVLAKLCRDWEITYGRPGTNRSRGTGTSWCRVTHYDPCCESLSQPGRPVRLPQKRYSPRIDEYKKVWPVDFVKKADPVPTGSAGCTCQSGTKGVHDGKAVVPLAVEHTSSTSWSKWWDGLVRIDPATSPRV